MSEGTIECTNTICPILSSSPSLEWHELVFILKQPSRTKFMSMISRSRRTRTPTLFFGTRFEAGSELLVAGPAKERTYWCEIDCEQLKVLEWEYFGGTMKIAGSDTPAAITRLRGVDSGREFVAGKCKEG